MSRKQKTPRRQSKNKSYWYDIKDLDQQYETTKFFNTYDDLKTINKPRNQVKITPRGENQRKYVESLENSNNYITFGIGPAGSGKTMLAVQVAIKAFMAGEIKKIVITRPNVAVDDRDIGHLPGDILGKMTPQMLPILDVFAEYYTQKEIKNMLTEKILDIVPIAFIRGRTFKDAIIIIDEAQGTTPNSLLSILTRIGDNSRMVITGDLEQKDHKVLDGLTDFVRRYENKTAIEGITLIRFDKRDIQRHKIIPSILEFYNEKELSLQY